MRFRCTHALSSASGYVSVLRRGVPVLSRPLPSRPSWSGFGTRAGGRGFGQMWTDERERGEKKALEGAGSSFSLRRKWSDENDHRAASTSPSGLRITAWVARPSAKVGHSLAAPLKRRCLKSTTTTQAPPSS